MTWLTTRGDPDIHAIPRMGDLDLRVCGWLVAEAGVSPFGPHARGVLVRIVYTVEGRYVGHVVHWSNRDGEIEYHESAVCDAPAQLLAWLRRDGKLGRYSKAAWVDACAKLPELAGADVEVVA